MTSTRLPSTLPVFGRRLILATGIATLLTTSTWAADVRLVTGDLIDTSSFNAAGHWDSGEAPSAGNNYFTGAFGLRTPAGAFDYTFEGDSLTIGVGGSLGFKGYGYVRVENLILAGGTINQSLTGGNPEEGKLDGHINVVADSFFDTTSNSGRILTINSAITGTGGLRIMGAGGTVNFTDPVNDYTGIITLGGSTGRTTALVVSSLNFGGEFSALGASSAAASNLVFEGGTLRVNGAGGLTDRLFTLSTFGGTIESSGTGALAFVSTEAFAFAGAGPRTLTLGGSNTGLNTFALKITDNEGATGLTKAGAGTWILSGDNTYTGRTTITGGTLEFATAAGLGDAASPVSIGGGTLRWGAGNATDFTAARTITLTGGTANLNTNGNSVTVAGLITGSGSLTKQGGGILTLSGTNTFTGNVTLGNNSGSIRITNSSSLGVGVKTIAVQGNEGGTNAPTLRLDGSAGSIHLPASFSFNTSNDGLNGNSTAPAFVNEAGHNAINGNFTLTTGGGGTRFLVEGGSLTLNGKLTPNAAGRAVLLSGAGSGMVNGILQNGTTGDQQLAVTKDGSGTWLLTGANTYSLTTNVNGGTLITTTASTGAGAVTVANGAAFGVRVASAGATFKTSNLTVNGTAGASLSMDFGVFGNPVAAAITTTTFNPNGVVNIGFSGMNLTVGQFKLVSYSTLGGGGFGALALTLPPRAAGSLVNNTAGSSVDLNLTAYDFPKWTGTNSTDWDTTTQNWREVNSGNVTAYIQEANGSDSVLFDDTASTGTVNLTGTLTPANVLVNNTTQTYTFTGPGSLGGTGSLVKQGTGTLILANTGSNTYGTTTISGGTVQIGDGVTPGVGRFGSGSVLNDGVIAFNRPGDFSVSNVISGSGDITKAGDGVLTLAANNSFLGTLRINAGTVLVGASTALGSSTGKTIVASGATLDINGINLGAEPITISGAGVGGAGALVNSGLQQNDALRFVTLAGDATVGGTGRFDIRAVGTGGGETLDLAGHTLTKVGTNQFSLVGATVTAGNVLVNEGTFSIETTTTMGSGGTLTANAGGTVQFYLTEAGKITRPMIWNGNAVTNAGVNSIVDSPITLGANVAVTSSNNTLTLNGAISGASGFTKTGGGTLELGGVEANTYTGVTTIEAGTVRFNKPAGTNAIGGDLVVTGTAQIAYATGAVNQIADTATLTHNGTTQSLTLMGETIANAIVNASNGGQIVVNNGVKVTGQVTINSGVYSAASGGESSAGSILLNAGTLRVSANSGATTLNVGAGGITAAGGVIEMAQGTGNYNAILNLGGNFTATGDVLINDGGYTGANLREVNLGAATRTFDIAEGTRTTMHADIAGTGGLIKTGGGVLDLTSRNSSTYTGATNVDAGTLMVQGALAGSLVTVGPAGTLQGTGTINAPVLVQGALQPGAAQPGTLTLGATNLTLSSNAVVTLELGGLFSFDRVAGIDQLTLDGTIAVSLFDGFTPTAGDSFQLFDFASVNAASFSVANDLLLPTLGGGLSWNTDQFLSAGTLAVVPEPGSLITLLGGMGMMLGFRRIRRH